MVDIIPVQVPPPRSRLISEASQELARKKRGKDGGYSFQQLYTFLALFLESTSFLKFLIPYRSIPLFDNQLNVEFTSRRSLE